jgi:tetratricopeptide (TPR) repeat protein
VLDLASLPQDRINAMIGGARSLTPDRQRTAVMLHTDTTYALLLAGTTSSGLFPIGAARRVFAIARAGHPADERMAVFERRWFAFVASLYTANSLFDRAEILIRDGLTLYPRDARLYVARGALLETRLAFTAFDPSSPTQLSRRERTLAPAAADYRHALALDPNLPMALLRLGALHLTVRDARARENLETALRVSSEPIASYLAHLLLGAVAERDNRLDAAEREYQAAQAIAAACQTPYVALARIATARGDDARAQTLASAFANLAEKSSDPWWDFHLGGFDQASLNWLRTEARAR